MTNISYVWLDLDLIVGSMSGLVSIRLFLDWLIQIVNLDLDSVRQLINLI